MTEPIPTPLLLGFNALASLSPLEAIAMKDSVIKALTEHPFFKNIPLDPLAAAGKILEETTRLTGAGDRSSIPARNEHLSHVIKELTRVGLQVQLQAMDEESQLHTSGFPVPERRTRVHRTVRGAVTALTGLEATDLKEEGCVMLNADSQDDAFGYQFQVTKEDPKLEANWVDDGPAPHRSCKKVAIRGLDSLSKYSFRGRAIGDNGPGPWSDYVTISVT